MSCITYISGVVGDWQRVAEYCYGQKEEEMLRQRGLNGTRRLVQVLSVLGALLLGPSGLHSAHCEALGRQAELGSVAERKPAGKLWKASVVAFAAMQAADAGTSYGYREANPIYGQRFGARGIAIKALIAVAVPLVERRIVRHHQGTERAFTALNFGLAGGTSRAVIYNARDMASKPAPIGIIPGVPTVSYPH